MGGCILTTDKVSYVFWMVAPMPRLHVFHYQIYQLYLHLQVGGVPVWLWFRKSFRPSHSLMLHALGGICYTIICHWIHLSPSVVSYIKYTCPYLPIHARRLSKCSLMLKIDPLCLSFCVITNEPLNIVTIPYHELYGCDDVVRYMCFLRRSNFRARHKSSRCLLWQWVWMHCSFVMSSLSASLWPAMIQIWWISSNS